ncbi:MAG: Nif3-like dinuclear metal center hexameric protein [Bacteroidales bacterium]|nr:Nif3-like dinuclear metal center hexameric protein [Bacteroidales bacterium]
MKINEVISYLDNRFPPALQESYDNSGFLLGDRNVEIKGVLVAVDLTLDVIEEALQYGCNLIVTHHPFIFSGIKRITTDSFMGRMLYMLLNNNIAVYAAHTNLDNLATGVNDILSKKLGIVDTKILSPMSDKLRKLVVYVPTIYASKVREAMFAVGAGCIGNYDSCSFNSNGKGTFRAMDGTSPFVGKVGELHTEVEERIEVVYPIMYEKSILRAMKSVHPYEEPAYDCLPLTNTWDRVGAGMVGLLPEPMPAIDFLKKVKEILGIPVIRHSDLCFDTVHTVAICGGAGSFLIGNAKAAKADIYLTGDLKYHDFQQAEGRIILADIGHFESEQFVKDLIYWEISKKFSIFVSRISTKNRGFVLYI